MFAVFYDLETTDRHPIGQILNYSFILVDDSFAIVDELSGLIRISRLQLPDPGAILANRTNVLDHQRSAEDDERAALLKIKKFIETSVTRASGNVALIGFNSSKFDLTYLRTSFMRNGIDPFFNNKTTPRDLLHAVQKAYLTSERFRSLVIAARGSEKKLSLSLEKVCHALGLLEGAQAHESRADVVLTIKVAHWLREQVGIDATTFDAYEALRLHSTARGGTVYMVESPEYDLAASTYAVSTPVTLLDADGRQGLWIDLARYAERQEPSCIMWRSIAKHALFTSGRSVETPDLKQLARSALTQFKGITLKNYFSETSCDIEVDLYRADFASRALLNEAIDKGDRAVLERCHPKFAKDIKALWVRFQLARPDLDLSNPKNAEMLKRYAEYRYGGSLQLARSQPRKDDAEAFAATLSESLRSIHKLKDVALAQDQPENFALLEALEEFYQRSDIVKLTGQKLLPQGPADRNGVG